MFAVLLVYCLQFSFWFLFYLFLFSVIYFCFLQNQENSPNEARYNPNNRKIAKIDAACDRRVPRPQAVDADARTQTHTHSLRTPHIAQFAATISIACLHVFIFQMYIHLRHDEFSPAACLFIIHKLFVDISMLLFCEFSECQTKNENEKRQRKRKTCAMAKLLLPLLYL